MSKNGIVMIGSGWEKTRLNGRHMDVNLKVGAAVQKKPGANAPGLFVVANYKCCLQSVPKTQHGLKSQSVRSVALWCAVIEQIATVQER